MGFETPASHAQPTTNTNTHERHHPMKKILLVGAALVAALTLSACTSDTDTPTATPSATASPVAPLDREAPATGGFSDEDAFILAYEDEFGSVPASMESALLDLGYAICDGFDVGLTPDDVLAASAGSGVGPAEAGFITGDAVATLCPVHTPVIEDYLAANGYGA